jgi:hypothetical protein
MKSAAGSRKVFLRRLILAAVLLSLPARPDNLSIPPRVGILVPPIPSVFEVSLRESLRELGYIDRNSVLLDLSTFHLLVNLRAAKAQGITIPESFLLLTDEVIR